MWVLLTEWNGLAAVVDGSDDGGATDASGSSGSFQLGITTTSPRDLLVFAISTYGTVAAQGLPWQAVDSTGDNSVSQTAEYASTCGSGVQSAHTTFNADYDAVLAGFPITP